MDKSKIISQDSMKAGDANMWNGDVIQFRYDFTPVKFGGTAATTWSENATNMAFGLRDDGKTQAWSWVPHNADCPGVKLAVVYDEKAETTTYEYAIPAKELPKADLAAGTEFAVCLTRVFASKGNAYGGWFSWGDGVCAPQDDKTRVGANTVVLSDEDAIVEEAPAASAATSDAGIVMFAALAIISLAGVMVAKKVR